MVAWLLKCNISRLFMNFKKNLKQMRNAYFLCSKQTFYIIRMPISYSTHRAELFSSIYHFFFFLWLQRSIGQPKVIFFYKFPKIIIKKRITKKKNLSVPCVLLDHFYLLISLEGMSTFIRSRASFEDQIWDIHLYNV